MSAISNTTVISNFAAIGELDLLKCLFGSLYISLDVYEEIQNGREEGYLFYDALDQIIFPYAERGWIILTSLQAEEEFRLYRQFPSRLHQGEASSLAIACYRGWLFLSDDFDARTAAKRLNIRLSGSVGCLVLLAERGICSLNAANHLLRRMIEQGYRSPILDLTELIS